MDTYETTHNQVEEDNNSDLESTPDSSSNEEKKTERESGPTRHDLQLPRRFFHMSMGLAVAIFYNLFLTHTRVVHILGTIACLLYVFEQVRITYPNLLKKAQRYIDWFYRAEEQLHESSAIPYAIAILLTILTFPKIIAVTAVSILAVADPLSAIVGISLGKHKIAGGNKSVEGSVTFFICSFLLTLLIFGSFYGLVWPIALTAFLLALSVTMFEAIPLKIDDNLTIPLFASFALWIICAIVDIPV